MAEPPKLVLVTGLPGTGKSTVAAAAAQILGTAVIAHDWAMSGLRTYPEIERALDGMELGRRHVGWSILVALARSQLVNHRSIVLDGVARSRQIDDCAAMATEVGASFSVVTTRCSDPSVHRRRIEGRRRHIPNWYELDWADVERSAANWAVVNGDLDLDSVRPWEENENSLRSFLATP